MKKIAYISKDEHNAIAVCRDHFNGVVVQVIRFIDQLRPEGPEKKLVNVKTNQVVKSYIVKIEKGKEFKAEVDKSINEAKEFLAGIRLNDKAIDGLLNDFVSQNPGLNNDGKEG